MLLSIGTIGVGFFARPIGAIILSHFGDRLGRKSLLADLEFPRHSPRGLRCGVAGC
jgi:MFS family permease